MKKIAILIIALLVIIPMANADDGPLKITAKATKVHLAVDKNANTYVRIIFQKPMVVEGIALTVDTMLMCFGSTYDFAKGLRPGQTFSVIARPSHYKGNINYQALKFIE